MLLDRRMTQEIAQALLRAKSNKDRGDNVPGNITQTNTASGDGHSGEPVIARMGFLSASQPAAMTRNRATSQSRELTSTHRLHPFPGPARLSFTDDAADIVKARDTQVHLASNAAPSASSQPPDPQTINGQPLAVGGTLGPGYWNYIWEGLFPPYCKSTDDSLTFPPLINQVTEADKIACQKQHESDQEQCYENHSYKPEALWGCLDRADTNRDLCFRGEKELSPWNDSDTDGIKLPKPSKRWKRKR